jgi:hypothetical protein
MVDYSMPAEEDSDTGKASCPFVKAKVCQTVARAIEIRSRDLCAGLDVAAHTPKRESEETGVRL